MGIPAVARQKLLSARAALSRFCRPSSFGLPSTPDGAALRLVRNFRSFRLHYSLLLYITLLLTLLPHRRSTLFFLMASSKLLAFYLLLLRTFPSFPLLRRRRLVLSFMASIVLLELVLTDSLRHLFMAVGVAGPLMAAHAVCKVAEDGEAEEDREKKADEVV